MRSSDWSSDGCSSDLVFRTEMVQLNTKKKPFDDQRVRQALNYAVDKDALIQGVLRGNGTPAVSSLPAMAYHNADLARKSVVSGKRVPVRVVLGGGRIIKKKQAVEHSAEKK